MQRACLYISSTRSPFARRKKLQIVSKKLVYSESFPIFANIMLDLNAYNNENRSYLISIGSKAP